MQQQTSSLDHAEARAELTAMLDEVLGRIPTDLVVEHLMGAYADAGWPVLRDAGLALSRRLEALEREALRVATRPPRSAAIGRWTTKRARGPERPYEILVTSIDPLRVACDCPDYGKGGLGLCKHGLAVLRELASKPRALARLRGGAASRATTPPVSWWPIRAIEGPGDWLEGVRLHVSSRADVPSALRPVAVPVDGGGFRLDTDRLVGDKLRRRVVEALASLRSRAPRDPALRARLSAEGMRLDRIATLRPVRARLQRLLSDLDLRLYPYQREGVERFFASGRMLLADDMGLGKTVQATAIAHALVRADRVRRVLVVAPASLKSQWVREWRRATDISIAIVEGTPSARAAIYDRTDRGVLVANYEQTLRDLDLMRAWAPDFVILDEAQRIKNWATRTARTVKELDPPYRLVLTGTPLENRLDELASIMDWVDPFALSPKWRLAATHDVTADGEGEVVGVHRLHVLRQRLAPHMLRRRRTEILTDLPPRTDTIHGVEMSAAQAGAHADLDLPIARLVRIARRRGLTHAQFLRLMSLLTTQRVIANGMAQLQFQHVWPSLRRQPPDEATLQTIAMPKLGHLREIVGAVAVDQRRKIVVFSQWRRALVLASWAIGDLLQRAGLRAAFFSGDESQRQRTKNVVEFHDDPSLAVLLCTDAGGVGLNLQRAASCCINLELPWNPAVLEQRIARIHRLGQSEPIDVHMLVSESSIEQRIASAVANKRALFSGLFDGTTEEVRFEGARGFLSTVERLVDEAAILAAGEDTDERAEELDLEVEPDGSDTLLDRADERTDAPSNANTSASEAEPTGTPQALPTAEAVSALMADLRVEPMPDGRVRIDASPDAARTLGALLSGVAQLLQQASHGETTTSAGSR